LVFEKQPIRVRKSWQGISFKILHI
jgi:hypothetical protein